VHNTLCIFQTQLQKGLRYNNFTPHTRIHTYRTIHRTQDSWSKV